VAAVALTLVVSTTAYADGHSADGHRADGHDHGHRVTRQDVADAQAAAAGKARDVASVRADLAAANQRLEASAIKAAQASEAWNGARYDYQQAKAAARAAERRAGIASTDVEDQQQAYADTLVSSYQDSPELAALSAIVRSDGIDQVIQQATTMRVTEQAMSNQYDRFRATATIADVSSKQAAAAQAAAANLKEEAKVARDRATQAQLAAAAEAGAIAEQKDQLIAELADLQHISTRLATQRQAQIEARQQAAAAAAAQAAAEQAAQEAAQEAAQQAAQQTQQTPSAPSQPSPPSQPSQPSQPSPPPAPSVPPAPAGGANAAIAFARDQIGDPYVWGATGPDSWDCSGLTMGAWSAGGISLPHYSVAQYEQSTPISPSDLKPGDLVFWGSSSNPSSIYHVALYSGNGMIIQAPRTGRSVEEVSMYYWTTPNFYARP
jgi:cell wall-associated NlpC family hydrolase